MGNHNNKQLKQSYYNDRIHFPQTVNDRIFGEHTIFKIQNNPDYFMKKVLNPSLQDQYADIDELTDFLNLSSKYFTELQFFNCAKQFNREIFELFYSYGQNQKNENFEEQQIIQALQLMIEVFEFLKQKNFYYPCFNKNYLVKIQGQLKFLNPLISDEFLVCLINKQKSDFLTKRKIRIGLEKNLKQFGFFIVNLACNANENLYQENLIYKETILKQIKLNYSQNLFQLVQEINSTNISSINQIKDLLDNYKNNLQQNLQKEQTNKSDLVFTNFYQNHVQIKKKDFSKNKEIQRIPFKNVTTSVANIEKNRFQDSDYFAQKLQPHNYLKKDYQTRFSVQPQKLQRNNFTVLQREQPQTKFSINQNTTVALDTNFFVLQAPQQKFMTLTKNGIQKFQTIIKNHIERDQQYKEVRKVVDFNDPKRPSNYHMVDDDQQQNSQIQDSMLTKSNRFSHPVKYRSISRNRYYQQPLYANY